MLTRMISAGITKMWGSHKGGLIRFLVSKITAVVDSELRSAKQDDQCWHYENMGGPQGLIDQIFGVKNHSRC